MKFDFPVTTTSRTARSSSNIGKTDMKFFERTKEDANPNKNSRDSSAIYERLPTCRHYIHTVDLFRGSEF